MRRCLNGRAGALFKDAEITMPQGEERGGTARFLEKWEVMKMAKQVTQEKRLEKSQERIDKVFNWCDNEKFTLKENKTTGTKTVDYRQKTRRIMKLYYEEYGVGDITFVDKEKMHDLLIKTYTNPNTLHSYAYAIQYFSKATEVSATFKEKIDIVDTEYIEDYKRENDMLRRAKDSTVLRSTPEENRRVIEELGKSRSKFREQAQLGIRFAEVTSARAEGVFNCRGKDIALNNDGTATVYLKEKGDNERWVDVSDPDHVSFLKDLKSGLKNENMRIMPPLVYQSGKNKGKFMSDKVAQQRMGDVIQAAAVRVGLSTDVKDEPSFSLHSARKTFCQTRVDEYARLSYDQLKAVLEERYRKHDDIEKRLQKERPDYTITSIRKKYKTNLERINWVDKRKGIRRTEVDRDLNHKELCLLLTSFDSGHFRIDVMRYYCTYPHGK